MKLNLKIEKLSHEASYLDEYMKAYMDVDIDGNITNLFKKVKDNGGNIGKINFILKWNDGNDLDLHVKCLCGHEVFFSMK
jgi:hypothetical protein